MQRVKWSWNAFKNVAIIFSFVVNLVLIITLLIVGLLLFQIKNGIAEPLIDGLHSSFVGLDQATIDRIIPVREEIPVQFTLPLQQNTEVILTAPVPLQANAQFNLPGEGGTINGVVSIVLPEGLNLPVSLDLEVPVDTQLPVALDVRAVIPLAETQLHDAFVNLRDLLEPFVRALDNLPSNGEEGGAWLSAVIAGQGPDLLAPTDGSMHPWPGYSRTAGTGYTWPADMPPQPGYDTGVVPGGLGEWTVPPGAEDSFYDPARQSVPAATADSPAEAAPTEVPATLVAPEPSEEDMGLILATPTP